MTSKKIIAIFIMAFIGGFIIGGYVVGKKAGIYKADSIYLHSVNVEVSNGKYLKALKTNNYLKIEDEKEISLFNIQWLHENGWVLIFTRHDGLKFEYIFRR